jgi:hypothetical protein
LLVIGTFVSQKNTMKKLLILSLLLLAFAAQAQSDKSKKSSNDKQAIENLILQYGEAINASSIEKVLAAFTKDGVLMAPGAPIATGQNQLKAKSPADPRQWSRRRRRSLCVL